MSPKRVVIGEKERFGAWALEQIGYPDTWGPWFEAIGLESDGPETDGWRGHGRIIAAAVFTDYMPNVCITMHLAGTRDAFWCVPAFAVTCFRYAFIQCGVQRITAHVAASNERCQKFIENVGFVREGAMRAALPRGETAYIYGMLASEGGRRWIPSLNVAIH